MAADTDTDEGYLTPDAELDEILEPLPRDTEVRLRPFVYDMEREAKLNAVLLDRVERNDPDLVELIFPYMNMSQRDIEAYARALRRNVVIRRLYIGPYKSQTPLSVLLEAFYSWDGSQRNTTLNFLQLEGFRIDAALMVEIAELLRNNKSLTHLSLTESQINEISLGALSHTLISNTTLRSLDLSGNNLKLLGSERYVQVMATILRNNSSLESLDLSESNLNEEGMRTLLSALRERPLELELSLGSCQFYDSPQIFQTLAEDLRTNTTLTSLALNDNSVGDEGSEMLTQGLLTNSTLRSLSLSTSEVGDRGAAALGQVLAVNSTLTRLILYYNSEIGDVGARALARGLMANAGLEILDLDGTQIGDAGATDLCRALVVNTSLTELDLGKCSIGNLGGVELGKVLMVNSTLKTLRIESDGISDLGVIKIGQGLQVNAGLSTLSLGDSPLGDSGAWELAKALEVNPTLTHLDLSSTGIGASGAARLARTLATNSTLTTLILNGCRGIGDVGTQALGEVLPINSGLESLSMNWCGYTVQGVEALVEGLTYNSRITKLSVWYQDIPKEILNQIKELEHRNIQNSKRKGDQIFSLLFRSVATQQP